MTKLQNGVNGMPDDIEAKLKRSVVFTPETLGYSDMIKRWSKTVEKKPQYVVFVTCVEDISAAILFARAHGLELVVCGGGHLASGASSTDGGLVIDLRHMKEVAVDSPTKVVCAQAGCLTRDIDQATAKHGLAVPLGTISQVGIGGLTLGGGYGWLTGQHGLTIDNLLEVTMVLADGSVKKASATVNPDLFWAIRGAGPCFGVAVDFKFQAHTAPPNGCWSGPLIFSAKRHLDAVIDFANGFIAEADGKAAMALGIAQPPFLPEMALMASIFYNGGKEEAMQVFGPLYALDPLKDFTSQRPYHEINTLADDAVKPGIRRAAKGACFLTPIRASFVTKLIDELSDFTQRVPDARNSGILLELYPTQKSASVPITATAFANRGPHQNVQIGASWTDAANDTSCKAWGARIADIVGEELDAARKQRGNPPDLQHITEYRNYDGLGTADSQRIFGVNYDGLALLKGRYDPDNVFKGGYPELG